MGTFSGNYSFELMRAAQKLLAEVMLVRPGEEVLTTVDTIADMHVAMAISQAAYNLGRRPTLILNETRSRSQMEPPEVVAGAVAKADVWIDLPVQYILYTKTQQVATSNRYRHACLSGLDADALVNTLGNVDYPRMMTFGNELVTMLNLANEIRVTSEKGTDLTGQLSGDAFQPGGIATNRGALVMLGGQVGHLPIEETINGKIFVDGEIWPQGEVGILNDPAELSIDKGKICDVKGLSEDVLYKRWLNSFNDPNLFCMAHYAYGFNPGVSKLSGRIVLDERVFGAINFGFGTSNKRNAATHSDCIVLNPTVWLDGIEIERDGRFTHPTLVEHCREMLVPGY